jgi:hypothetical protein
MCRIPSFCATVTLCAKPHECEAVQTHITPGRDNLEGGMESGKGRVVLWACKRPLPYSHRRPTLFQPVHSGVDIVGSIQGLRQWVEQTHPPMVLRSRSWQFSGWASCRNGHGKRHTQRYGLGKLLGSVHMTQDTCGKQFLPTSSARF